MVRLTDRPDMTLDVYRGRKTTMQRTIHYISRVFILRLVYFSASHPDSTFDLALSGILEPNTSIHSTETLGEICRVLKPSARLILGETITGDSSDESKIKTTEKLNSCLTVSGFVNIEQVSLSYR